MDVNHIAIILDGNRRWAKDRGLDKYIGHKEGAKNLEELTKKANEKGLKYLTVYTFSTENWKRSKEEVSYLMKIFTIYFKRLLKRVNKYNIKIKFFSSRDGLTKDLIKMIDEIEEISKNNTGLQINLCFNYGGRREITEATRKIAEDVLAGKIKPEGITEEMFSKKLYSGEIPDPDILIRTSGEKRLSNFLPWQLTYSEFFFVNKHWPDFKIDDLEEIVKEYNTRNRRFGAG
jgi:di-trans,poly-cis-decaprenylcistransferase